MPYNPYENYLESQILSASPLQLVSILYRAAIDALTSARAHLAAGDIRGRTQSSTQAQAVLAELTQSVDRQQGGDFSTRLVELYAYMLRRSHEANVNQDDAAYAECVQLLNTLLEGWTALEESVERTTATEVEEPYAHREPIECSF